MSKQPLFIAESNGVTEEIHDLYWFEENGVHDFSGQGHYQKYKIRHAHDSRLSSLTILHQRALNRCQSFADTREIIRDLLDAAGDRADERITELAEEWLQLMDDCEDQQRKDAETLKDVMEEYEPAT